MTVAATYAPQSTSRAAWWTYQIILTLAGSLLIALTAQISFYLPFSPVPVTGQTLGILLVGTLLGSVRGSMAVLAYLAEGASGLPVFAGGALGPGALLRSHGGLPAGLCAGGVCDGLSGRTRL